MIIRYNSNPLYFSLEPWCRPALAMGGQGGHCAMRIYGLPGAGHDGQHHPPARSSYPPHARKGLATNPFWGLRLHARSRVRK